MEQRTDRPYVIQFIDKPPIRRMSLPNSVYIDIPGTHNSQQTHPTSQNSSIWLADSNNSGRELNQNYVEETIFYDQFEDRRIDVSKTAISNAVFSRPAPPVPSIPRYTPPVEYNTQPDDGFPLPPLPVMDIPDPPPAYTEIDEQRDRNTAPVRPVFRGHQLSGGVPRKLITCPFCRTRVYTIVIRESGVLTHVIAAIVFFICLPIIFCIYLTDFCKYKNHYCPNCNSMIGYEIPLLCTDMAYTRTCVIHNHGS
ncbi:lipopolysaccharide-induced tumor necrosis factor-alpha factor homolog [Pieris brassicae]|nr:lipopolysaccharide-induced tumor necrosis factor-alpha factor homolog [Pieris brassicae]